MNGLVRPSEWCVWAQASDTRGSSLLANPEGRAGESTATSLTAPSGVSFSDLRLSMTTMGPRWYSLRGEPLRISSCGKTRRQGRVRMMDGESLLRTSSSSYSLAVESPASCTGYVAWPQPRAAALIQQSTGNLARPSSPGSVSSFNLSCCVCHRSCWPAKVAGSRARVSVPPFQPSRRLDAVTRPPKGIPACPPAAPSTG